MSSDIGLTAARYGKDKVRVFRIVRGEKWHDIVEYNVCTLLEGDIATRYAAHINYLTRTGYSDELIDISYTQADNSVVVATDSGVFYSSPMHSMF